MVDRVLSEMKLTTLPERTGEDRLPRGAQAGMIIADDELHSAQAARDKAVEKAAPVDLGLGQRDGDAENATTAIRLDANG